MIYRIAQLKMCYVLVVQYWVVTKMSREGKVYVGNLPPDVKQRDLEDLFYKFGKITNINLKNSTQQPFAFLEFDDPRYVCMLN